MQEFYSNGKLLLSGEYAVLDGAKAWAMPTKFGQFLKVTHNKSTLLSWNSLDVEGNSWFTGIYDLKTLAEISGTDKETSRILQRILIEAQKLNPAFLSNSIGIAIESRLTFPKNWGLGASSTLLNNVALWSQVDAYKLLWNAFSGSGYDIACAQTNSPIVYQLEKGIPSIKQIDTKPLFSDSLYFVYLNKKRNSRDAISAYRQRNVNKALLVAKINELTTQMIGCTKIEDFEQLVNEHEDIISEALGLPTVKEELFSDFGGSMKSLGAWGGDFILVIGNNVTAGYFKDKGYGTILPFEEMIK